jgi:hypothetical protein
MEKLKPTNKKLRAVISICCSIGFFGGLVMMVFSLKGGWAWFVISLCIMAATGSTIAYVNVGEEEIIRM